LCALDETDARKYLAEVQSLAAKGYRVLAAALADCSADALPAGQQGFAFRLAGLVAFEDPIRPEVPDAIAACRQAGIKVIMITGDYPETARTIAAKAGLEHADEVITGKELQAMALAELQHKIQTARVFARIVPEQKLQIIQALKANGETVAMTGDGVNDAPALKAADIGVAMGLKGTDVAREAASLVLLDDNFATIVAAVRSGRRIFDNLQKAMTYILAIHLPIIGLVMLPAFIPDWPIMLMPLHIVFMELIIDPVSSIAFESQPEEADIMRRPPRKQYSGFFGWRNMAYSMLEGMLILGMAVGVYSLALGAGRSDGQVRALTFCALILGNLILVLASLSRNARIDQAFRSGNRTFIVIALAALLALGTALLIPGARGIFGFELPAASDFIWPLSGVLALFASLLLLKKLRLGMQD
jgi:Ca2+-transporting ATPase